MGCGQRSGLGEALGESRCRGYGVLAQRAVELLIADTTTGWKPTGDGTNPVTHHTPIPNNRGIPIGYVTLICRADHTRRCHFSGVESSSRGSDVVESANVINFGVVGFDVGWDPPRGVIGAPHRVIW